MSDPFFNDVSLLLPFRDGLYDLSPKRNIITSVGVALSSAQSKFYRKSAYFPTGTYYLSLPTACISGTTATIETWVNVNNLAATQRIFANGTGVYFDILSTGAVELSYESDTKNVTTGAGCVALDTWVHIAAVLTPSSASVFVDGVKTATSAIGATTNLSTTTNRIGTNAGNGLYPLSGYLQDFRITLAERYTTDFTPPEALWDDSLSPNVIVEPVDTRSYPIVLRESFLSLPDLYLSTWDGTINHTANKPELDRPNLSGNYRITGTVKELGKAGRYKVRLFDKLTAQCTRETWSKSDGSYVFDNIADTEYFVVAYDHGSSPKNAVIVDNVKPSISTSTDFNLCDATLPTIYLGANPVSAVYLGAYPL